MEVQNTTSLHFLRSLADFATGCLPGADASLAPFAQPLGSLLIKKKICQILTQD